MKMRKINVALMTAGLMIASTLVLADSPAVATGNVYISAEGPVVGDSPAIASGSVYVGDEVSNPEVQNDNIQSSADVDHAHAEGVVDQAEAAA